MADRSFISNTWRGREALLLGSSSENTDENWILSHKSWVTNVEEKKLDGGRGKA
jgi:hypothetical protein